MSKIDAARRATAEVAFGGVDITSTIKPYLLSLEYTDNEEDETDDLQLRLQDRDGTWLKKWLNDTIQAASTTTGLIIQATITRLNWNTDGKDLPLDCGTFELDSVSASVGPGEVTIKASSLPYNSAVRQTLKSKAWEGYYLSGIAAEMAGNAGMSCMYESSNDPYYERVEQYQCSDITFLQKLCHDAGISLKATALILVLFDQAEYEAKESVLTITNGDGSYEKMKLQTGAADTQYTSCRVAYTDPMTGSLIEGKAYAETDSGSDNEQCLEIVAKVASVGEAQELASKSLRLHNKFFRTASCTIPGNPAVVAGVTVTLNGFGGWSGNYIVKQAKHKVGSGYTTDLTLRAVLEGI